MRRFKLVVLSNAKDGREDEYNQWYNNRHLADVVAVPGFSSAQRFKLRDDMGFPHRHQYLAIYEIESDDPQAVIGELMRRRDTPAMLISEALDLESAVSGLFEICSPVVQSGMKTCESAEKGP